VQCLKWMPIDMPNNTTTKHSTNPKTIEMITHLAPTESLTVVIDGILTAPKPLS
jgi:hypothetical protein